MTSPIKVLVLGGSGFVGRAVAAECARHGDAVRSVGSADLDLRSPESVPMLQRWVGPDTVVIMAAALTRDRGGETADAFAGNVAMVVHVSEAIRRSPPAQCIYLSSDAVYGEHQTNLLRDERVVPAPGTLYAIAKLAGEHLLKDAAARAGSVLTILRPCRIYGPGDGHPTYGPARFVASARAGGAIELFGRGEERRDFLYIDDLVAVIRGAMERRVSGLFNAATGESRSFAEVAAELARLIPGTRIAHAPRVRPVCHLGFTVDALRRAFPAVRWTMLEEGLARTVQSEPPTAAHTQEQGALACPK